MQESINAIRVLSIDMIEKANSGHPGICMGAAPIMYSLFRNHLVIDSSNDKSELRDRFVLSAGHGSAMLYSTLYLSGLGLSKGDLQNFRQINSKTPGHPEITHTKFVDATSGPLGQGIAQGVGMALAEAHNAAKYNKGGAKVVDNYTYVLCGDGDLQEGVSAEASSLAGHFNLNKLIIVWDSNDIQLDNPTEVAISEDIKKRYEAYGFDYIKVEDGNNIEEIDKAISLAKNNNHPTLIEVKTIIGYGSPNKSAKPDSHGAPLGADETQKAKEFYGWTKEAFEVDDAIFKDFQNAIKERFENKQKSYNENLELLKKTSEVLYKEYMSIIKGEINLNINFDYKEIGESIATRVASGEAIQKIDKAIPNLFGGSADLSKSNNSTIMDGGVFSRNSYASKNIPFGVREFGMAAIVNGINLYSMNKTFCATFFVFSDYLKAAIRMSAISEIPSIYVLTHDSIAVGEDGATHEPIEQITGLRAIPNVNVIRPCDYNECQVAWKEALQSTKTPTVLVLSRQNLEVVATKEVAQKLSLGAYVIKDSKEVDKILIATGSEVPLAIKVADKLSEEGIGTRVVSMPSTSLFEKQSKEYQDEILLRGTLCKKHKYFIEMSSALIGYKYANNVINIEEFGKSGDGSAIIKDYNFTVDFIVDKIKN